MTQTAPAIAAPAPVGTDVTAGPLTLRLEEAIVADGTATVAATSAQSDAPPAGLAYVLARLTVTNGGQRAVPIAASDFLATGTDGVLRPCPSVALPDPPLDALIGPGEVFTGWTTGLVNDTGNVVLLFDPAVGAGERFAATFALTDGATIPTFDTAAAPSDAGTSLGAPAGLGQPVTTATWEVIVNSTIGSDAFYERSDYRVQALGTPASGDWQALGLEVTVRNVSLAPQFFSWTALELIDTNGEPWDHLLAMTQPEPPASVALLPGASWTGWYGIWLWPWATTSLLQLRDSILSDDLRYISLDGTAGAAGAAEPPPEPLDAAPGDVVAVGADPLNLRAEPAASADLVAELEPGTQLAITGDPVEADGFRWYPVEVTGTGQAGYVVAQYLVPASE